MAAPSPDHDRVRQAVEELLARAQAAGYGERYASTQLAAAIAGRSRIPDLFFVRAERLPTDAEQEFAGVPDLVVEILSPRTRDEDLPGGEKWQDYEALGVPHYWIADPEIRLIATYEWRAGGYTSPTILGRGDALTSPLFPGLSLAIETVFARVKQPERRWRGLGRFDLPTHPPSE